MFFKKQTSGGRADGFSLVEILVAVVILLLLGGLLFSVFRPLNDNQLLQFGAETIVANLELARSKTLASENGSQFGVYFEPVRLVLFRGAAYPGTTEREVVFNSRVLLSEINLAGGASVVFERLTGATDNVGTLILSLVDDENRQKVIRVNGSGLVELLAGP